ncbi:hypothetical protein BRC64_01350 [Halobacteriales archaeon QH_10_67_22]|nr:MAG: hypothetical protein BRC64_01350 [Halobacteriales archaeon QH_10_67_22]
MSPDGPDRTDPTQSTPSDGAPAEADETPTANDDRAVDAAVAPSTGSDDRTRVEYGRIALGVVSLATMWVALVGPSGPTWDRGLELSVVLYLLVFVVLFVDDPVWFTSEDDREEATLPERRVRTEAARNVVGGPFDEQVGVFEDVDTSGTVGARSTVYWLAVDTLVREGGYDKQRADDALAAGTWTDDPRAAAYFSDDPMPLAIQIRDWLAGERERRQVEAALAELAEIAGATTDDDGETGRRLVVSDDDTPSTDTITETGRRWHAGVAVTFAAGVAGVALASTALFLSALVGLVYSAYAAVPFSPQGRLHVQRTVEPRAASPGERVSVTTTVENVGDDVLADVRVHDAPPTELRVLAGETRAAASLTPGETLTVEYELRARRGTHAFGDVTTVAYGLSGDAGRRTVHEGEAELTCFAPFDALELAPQAGPGTGQVQTASGGEGLEFFATREYRPSDPSSRIDWNRYASTGELSTVTYRESHAATVVLLVDGRHRVRRRSDEPTAAALCGYAAVRAGEALLDDHNSVGTVALGLDGDDPDDPVVDRSRVEKLRTFSFDNLRVAGHCRPDRGREQSLRVRTLVERELDARIGDVVGGGGDRGVSAEADRESEDGTETDREGGRSISVYGKDETMRLDWTDDGASGMSADSSVRQATAGEETVDWLRGYLDDHAQVVFVSPLLDDGATEMVTRLESIGHTVTVVSPRVTTTDRPGGTVSHVRRALRVRSLRRDQQVRLVDWSPDDPLGVAAERAHAGWDS